MRDPHNWRCGDCGARVWSDGSEDQAPWCETCGFTTATPADEIDRVELASVIESAAGIIGYKVHLPNHGSPEQVELYKRLMKARDALRAVQP